MKITRKNPSIKKRILAASGAVVLLAIVSVAIMAFSHTGPFAGQDQQTKPLVNGDDSTDRLKPATSTNTDSTASGKTPLDNQPTDNNPAANELVATITSSNQNEDILQIRTLIENITNDGTCDLVLTKDQNSVTRSVGIQALANSSTCKGFDIPVSELSEGQWQFTVDITISSNKTQLRGTVSIE